MSIKGIFASDIDNTLTDKRHLIPDEVVNYLVNLHNDGWQIVFLTGRTFSFAMMSMEKFDIPFILGVQNGAEVIHMPHAEIVYQGFIQKKLLARLEEIFADYNTGYLVYSGFEAGDYCFYNPDEFSNDMLDYFKKLQSLSSSAWSAIESIEEIDIDATPLVKCFGKRPELEEICARVEKDGLMNASVITDSVDPKKGILLITAKEVDKGKTLKRLCNEKGWKCPIVAAGDDENDLSLLQLADVSICVSGGSKKLEKHADIVAPPSREFGIIKAMDQVLERGRL